MSSRRLNGLSRRGGAFIIALVALTASMSQAGASPPSALSPQVALDWNVLAVSTVRAATTKDGAVPPATTRALYQTEGLLYMSYVQAAVYDATMKITHRYELYHHFSAGAGNASVEAAVVAAAYNTLVAYFGDANGSLAAAYAASIGALPKDGKTARGIAVGEAAAADIVNLRLNDGRNAAIDFACPDPATLDAGDWQCPPLPSIQSKQTPWMAVMRPFMLESDSQFRAPAPPALDSTTYTTDLNEVQAFGAKNSAVRTAQQKLIAYFWNANAMNQINQTMRGVAAQYGMDLVDTVRLLAAGELTSTDAGMACFDSKYTWLVWRPITAIRADGNPTDPTWSPLVTTPNHPEYPSQHGCVTAAFSRVLAKLLGTSDFNVTFWGAQDGASTITTSTVFPSESAVDSQLVNARVWIGFHYRTSVIRGEALGDSVADWTLQRYFLPADD